MPELLRIASGHRALAGSFERRKIIRTHRTISTQALEIETTNEVGRTTADCSVLGIAVYSAVSSVVFAVANFFIALLGFMRGAVPRKDTALFMGVSGLSVALFSLLLRGGDWLITSVL